MSNLQPLFTRWRSSQRGLRVQPTDSALLDALATAFIDSEAEEPDLGPTASTLAALTSSAILSIPAGDSEIPLWRLFGWFSKLARDVPESHERLVALLLVVRDLAPLERDGEQVVVWREMKVWEDLPIFGATMVEDYNSVPAGPEFLNISAFLARCTGSDEPRLQFVLYGLMALHTLLPSPSPPKSSPNDRSTLDTIHIWAPPVHFWVTLAGRRLFRALNGSRPIPGLTQEELVARLGEPLNEVWRRWIEELRKIEGNGLVRKQVREVARKTSEEMLVVQAELGGVYP